MSHVYLYLRPRLYMFAAGKNLVNSPSFIIVIVLACYMVACPASTRSFFFLCEFFSRLHLSWRRFCLFDCFCLCSVWASVYAFSIVSTSFHHHYCSVFSSCSSILSIFVCFLCPRRFRLRSLSVPRLPHHFVSPHFIDSHQVFLPSVSIRVSLLVCLPVFLSMSDIISKVWESLAAAAAPILMSLPARVCGQSAAADFRKCPRSAIPPIRYCGILTL